MAELTQEQNRKANQLLIGELGGSLGLPSLHELAETLQLPWDDVTEDEICEFGANSRDAKLPACNAGVALAISNFVRRRNAALLPKPVDPRRIVLLKKLIKFNVRDEQELDEEVTEILTALDETASQSDDHVG